MGVATHLDLLVLVGATATKNVVSNLIGMKFAGDCSLSEYASIDGVGFQI